MEGEFRAVAVRTVREAFAAAGRALFPHRCAGCGAEGRMLCDDCRIETMGPRKGLFACPGCGMATPFGARCFAPSCRACPLDGLASAAPYGDPVLRGLLRAWKYERVEEAGADVLSAFGAFLDRHGAALGPLMEGAVVVPVPLATLRLAARGFNQSDALAAVLAARIGTSPRRLLRRSGGGPAQASLTDRRERRRNVAGRFTAASGRIARPCLLVDDVATTTATLRECAAALKAAGAGGVWGFTLLRG